MLFVPTNIGQLHEFKIDLPWNPIGLKAFSQSTLRGSGYRFALLFFVSSRSRCKRSHPGSVAIEEALFLPGGSAAFDLPVIGPITGPAAGVAWKLYETSAQLSFLALQRSADEGATGVEPTED